MSKHRPRTGICLLVAACAATATIVPSISFHELVTRSNQIVTGRVVGSTTSWGAEHKFIWTHYEIAVSQVFKGPRQNTVIVSEPGGTLDGIRMEIAGAVSYAPGEHVALFLEQYPGGDKRTVRWAQGKIVLGAAGEAAGKRPPGPSESEIRTRVEREMRSGR